MRTEDDLTVAIERFVDRTAIVTGAASGIGRATARRLVSEGAKVLATDVAKDALVDAVAATQYLAVRAGPAPSPSRGPPK